MQALLLDNSLSGALCSTGTALDALVSVDLIVQIAHVDRFSGALCSAGTAGQALISDNKSHSVTSVCYLTIHLLGIYGLYMPYCITSCSKINCKICERYIFH